MVPPVPPMGVKIGKSLGLIGQVSGAGAGITPCWSGGSGRWMWIEGQRRHLRSGSSLLRNKPLRGREDMLSALFVIKAIKCVTLDYNR